MADLYWYTCVYEGEKRIIYGRAPEGDREVVLERIKRCLVFHELIGLRSQVFLRKERFGPDEPVEYCEQKAERDPGEYSGFKVVKLDLRWGCEEAGRQINSNETAGEQAMQ